MTKQEIIEEIKRQIQNGVPLNHENPEEGTLLGVEISEEDIWGGEGEGDHIGYVLKVTNNKDLFYVIVHGFYDSYNGSDYSYAAVHEVEPYMKTVRDWKSV